MIDRPEFDERAAQLGVNVADVQRDFVYDWLLVGIYTASQLADILVLKGGNAFRKAYFQNGRFSADLDFSTARELSIAFLESELQKVCHFASERTGIVFDVDRTLVDVKQQIDRKRVVYEARIYFQDFYGKPGRIIIKVKLDIVQFDRIYLPVQARHLIHQFSDADACAAEIRCQKLEELLATKLVCLLQRRHALDLFDLVFAIFVNNIINVDRREILRTFLRKTIFERRPGAAKGLLLGLPLQLFAGAWDRYLICPKDSLVGFEQAVQWYGSVIEEIFGPVAPFGHDATFYPSAMRSKVMDAAERQVLLRIRYHGAMRIAEPYSLAYKVRQDGHAQEYLYVWNRSGGNSDPGIRSLVSRDVEELEVTDEHFEPRYPIELSKSIESGSEGYFHRPFKADALLSHTPRARRKEAVRPGWVYVVECTFCRRRFSRSSRSTLLREHKDRYGNRCFGKRGYVVDQRYR